MAMETITRNRSFKNVRRETLNGQPHVVVPLTMIVEGVLNGSKGALFYPLSEMERNASDWNHVPLVLYHPMKDGHPVSARSKEVLNESGLGVILNARVVGKKLVAEGWFSEASLNKIAPDVLRRIEMGMPVELSTGLMTDNQKAPQGATHNGKSYDYIARNYRPDHLAILPDQVGACSLNDGCGVLVGNAESDTRFLAECPRGEFDLITNGWSAAARAAAIMARKKGRSLFRKTIGAAGKAVQGVTDKIDLKAARMAARFRKAYKVFKGPTAKGKASTPTAKAKVAPSSKRAKPGSSSPSGKGTVAKRKASTAKQKVAPAPKLSTKKGGTVKLTPAGQKMFDNQRKRRQAAIARKVTTNMSDDVINCGGKGGKPGPCKAGVNHPVGQVRLGMKRVGSSTFRHITTGHQVGASANKPGYYYVRDAKGRPLGTTTSLDKAFKKASKQPTANQENRMARLTANSRAKAIEFIITNSCGCFKEGDETVLESFSDDRLRELRLNAKRHLEGEESDPTNNGCGGGKMSKSHMIENATDEELATEMEKRKGKKTPPVSPAPPTANTVKTPLTTEDWMKEAPPEIQQVVRNAMASELAQKNQLVDAIVANAAEADRAGLKTLFLAKPLDELKTLSMLVANGQPSKPTPNYSGAAGAMFVGNSGSKTPTLNREAVLVAPRIDWSEVAANKN